MRKLSMKKGGGGGGGGWVSVHVESVGRRPRALRAQEEETLAPEAQSHLKGKYLLGGT